MYIFIHVYIYIDAFPFCRYGYRDVNGHAFHESLGAPYGEAYGPGGEHIYESMMMVSLPLRNT